MNINILSTESLGARGLCCSVTCGDRRILIDPGIALGYLRHGLMPHPFQVAFGNVIRKRIISELARATDVVISHFHGDHIPLINANPYQLPMQSVAGLLKGVRIWGPGPDNLSDVMRERRAAICLAAGADLAGPAGRREGVLRVSGEMPHGEWGNALGTVMMTRIEENGSVFVHASDIQLLDHSPIDQILEWDPDVVLVSGPPMYLRKLTGALCERAWAHALRLAEKVATLIIDHHLLRSLQGVRWLEDLNTKTDGHVICAADFMREERRFLEAWRGRLYRELPVPDGWHEGYAAGSADTADYQRWRDWDLSCGETGGGI